MARDDQVQHGIDHNPNNDPQKGATLGGLGGAAVGAAVGSMVDPVGTIDGAIVGGLGGAVGSGAAVAAVDSMDNDNTVTGLGNGGSSNTASTTDTTAGNWDGNEAAHRYAWETRSKPENRNRDWSEVETDLQSNWSAQHPNRPWETASASVREGWDTTGEVLRLREEQLHARKQNVQTGEVSLHKEVITENKTIEVPVTREEVVIERHPVQGGASGAVDASEIGEGETIRVPVMEEQVTLDKTAAVTEEVSIGKRQVQETRQVSGTVRHEEARIEQEGDTRINQ